MPTVSIVIPTFNAGPSFAALLDALKRQQPLAPDEIVVVDSGSRDATVELAQAAGATVVRYTERFNHGLARDAGIAAARGEIVVLTVQDALPADNGWLERMVRHFADSTVAGVSSRQIPPPDGPLELRIRAELDAAETAQPVRVALKDHPDYARYTAAEKLELYRFDDVSSALRKSVWSQMPFGTCTYAEDLQWARRALEAGHTLVRDPSAPVIHAHRRSFGYEFKRGLLDAWQLDELFGFRYSFLKRANRVTALLRSGSKTAQGSGRGEAFKTYSAHALARLLYGCYRWTLKPLGLGRAALVKYCGGV